MSTEAPHITLGIEVSASPQEARSRYLELVRQHPPDRDPERFREIHAAYQAFSDPLVQAKSLVSRSAPQPWDKLIDEAEQCPPRIPTEMLLALGNRNGSRSGNERGSA